MGFNSSSNQNNDEVVYESNSFLETVNSIDPIWDNLNDIKNLSDAVKLKFMIESSKSKKKIQEAIQPNNIELESFTNLLKEATFNSLKKEQDDLYRIIQVASVSILIITMFITPLFIMITQLTSFSTYKKLFLPVR